MSNTIKLPSGATATLRDPKTLKHKDRLLMFKGVTDDLSATERGMKTQDNMIAILVEDWTLDLILPSIKIETLGELDIPDYDALAQATENLLPALYPRLQSSPETETDPKATTAHSND